MIYEDVVFFLQKATRKRFSCVKMFAKALENVTFANLSPLRCAPPVSEAMSEAERTEKEIETKQQI